MRRRLRQRLIQTVVLGIVVAIGVWGYRNTVGPKRSILEDLAKAKLKQIFDSATVEFVAVTDAAPAATDPGAEASRIDLLRGVTLRGLTVKDPETGEVVLEADRVFLEHDLIELASGRYVPQRIRIEGPRITARETEDGLDLAIPFSLESADVGGSIPVIEVRDGKVAVTAMPGTTRFAGGDVVVQLVDVELDITMSPARKDEVRIRGGFRTRGLGQDDTRIEIHGPGWPKDDRVEVGVLWEGLRINEELLGILSEDIRRRLEKPAPEGTDPAFDESRLLVKKGDLLVVLMRDAAVDSGRVRAEVRWKGELPEKLASIPGAENIEIVSLEQLNALFATTDLQVVIREGSIDVNSVVALLGGGEIKGQATLDSEGSRIRATAPG